MTKLYTNSELAKALYELRDKYLKKNGDGLCVNCEGQRHRGITQLVKKIVLHSQEHNYNENSVHTVYSEKGIQGLIKGRNKASFAMGALELVLKGTAEEEVGEYLRKGLEI